MKDVTPRDDDRGPADHPCAQPICRHSRDDHQDHPPMPTLRLFGLRQPIPHDRPANVLGPDNLRQTTRTPRNILTPADPKHSGTRRHHCRDPGQDVRRHLNTSSAGLLGESVLGTVSTQAGTGWVLLDWFVVMLGRGGCRCGPTDPMRRGRRTLRG